MISAECMSQDMSADKYKSDFLTFFGKIYLNFYQEGTSHGNDLYKSDTVMKPQSALQKIKRLTKEYWGYQVFSFWLYFRRNKMFITFSSPLYIKMMILIGNNIVWCVDAAAAAARMRSCHPHFYFSLLLCPCSTQM